MLARVNEAFSRYHWQLLGYQPTLSWETLMACHKSQLVVELTRVHLDDYLDCQLLAETIIATRTARA
jgi:hypothetical protein